MIGNTVPRRATPDARERGQPMASTNVLLVSCYELGHAPQGIAWPLAFLREAGIEADALDLAVEPFSADRVANADVVAISVPMHTALRIGIDAAARIRAVRPAAHVCFHGLYAWLNADLLLAGPADSVLAGESEPALAALVTALREGRGPEGLPGVSTRARRAEPVRERLAFPVPRRDALPAKAAYARYVSGGQTHAAGYTESSRGCRHLCRHCPVVPVYRSRFFVVPVETVMADVRQQVAAGARHITFGDPDFLNGPGHADRVTEALHTEFSDLTFDFTAKVEHVVTHRALVARMKARGCTFVVSAVESLSDEVLARLDKGHTARDVETAIAILDAAGIALHATLVAFTPWTTLEDYIEQLEFFRSRGLTAHVPPIQLAIRLLVPPGSALLDEPDTKAWIGPLDPSAFSYAWSHPDPRMDRLWEAVAARVEQGEDRGEPPTQTWESVRALAHAAAGRTVREDEVMPPWFRPDPPRLTEHWFC